LRPRTPNSILTPVPPPAPDPAPDETAIAPSVRQAMRSGDPVCGACGHSLRGLYDSTRCPECGGAIIDVLVRGGRFGPRWTSEAMVGERPLVQIAFGPGPGEERGTARAVIALGDDARGLVAFGDRARGVVAIGRRARGVFVVGGTSFGCLTSFGFVSVAPVSFGFFSFGLLAAGMISVGALSIGAAASGLVAFGATVLVSFNGHVLGGTITLDELTRWVSWFYGPLQGGVARFIFQPLAVTIGIALAAGAVLSAAGRLFARRRRSSAS